MTKHYFEPDDRNRPSFSFFSASGRLLGGICRHCGEGISHENHGKPTTREPVQLDLFLDYVSQEVR